MNNRPSIGESTASPVIQDKNEMHPMETGTDFSQIHKKDTITSRDINKSSAQWESASQKDTKTDTVPSSRSSETTSTSEGTKPSMFSKNKMTNELMRSSTKDEKEENMKSTSHTKNEVRESSTWHSVNDSATDARLLSNTADPNSNNVNSLTNHRQPRTGWSFVNEDMSKSSRANEENPVGFTAKVGTSTDPQQIENNEFEDAPNWSKEARHTYHVLDSIETPNTKAYGDRIPMCMVPCSTESRSGRQYLSLIPKLVCGYLYGYSNKPHKDISDNENEHYHEKDFLDSQFFFAHPEASSGYKGGISEGVSSSLNFHRDLPVDIPTIHSGYYSHSSHQHDNLIPPVSPIRITALGSGLSHGASANTEVSSGANLEQLLASFLHFNNHNVVPQIHPARVPIPTAVAQPVYTDFTFSSPLTFEHDTRVLNPPLSHIPNVAFEGSSSYNINNKHSEHVPLRFPSAQFKA